MSNYIPPNLPECFNYDRGSLIERTEWLNDTEFIDHLRDPNGTIGWSYYELFEQLYRAHRLGGEPAIWMQGDEPGVEHWQYREHGVLHRVDGPAVVVMKNGKIYTKGNKDEKQKPLYCFHGIEVPKKWTEPGGLTVDSILNQDNPDVRAVGVNVFGVEKFVEEATEEIYEVDQGNDLTRALVKTKDGGKWMVCTDGSTKEVYTLKVDDNCTSCAEGYASLTRGRLKDEDCVGQG